MARGCSPAPITTRHEARGKSGPMLFPPMADSVPRPVYGVSKRSLWQEEDVYRGRGQG